MALVCQRQKREYCAAWDAKRKTCGALYLGRTIGVNTRRPRNDLPPPYQRPPHLRGVGPA